MSFGMDFVIAHALNIVKMKNEYSVKEKLILILLMAGICYFGVLLPDSLSDHNKIVHFSAHFGMSFLLGLCFYMICAIKMRMSKILTYMVLISATLFIGITYKYWEIATQGMIGNYSFQAILDSTGIPTSMSQNLSGLLGAVLLIEGLIDRNLAITVLKPRKFQANNHFPATPEN
jgi:glucan phosphoethanolaminetransferase (alkaline phosphatase superfamily)